MRHLIEAIDTTARSAVAPVFFLAAWSIGVALYWEPGTTSAREVDHDRACVMSAPVRWWELDPNGRDTVAESLELKRRKLIVEAFPFMASVF